MASLNVRFVSRSRGKEALVAERLGCIAMDEPHLVAALRYVSLYPVRARLVQRAQDWRWASTRAALAPIHDRFPDFAYCWSPSRKQIYPAERRALARQ